MADFPLSLKRWVSVTLPHHEKKSQLFTEASSIAFQGGLRRFSGLSTFLASFRSNLSFALTGCNHREGCFPRGLDRCQICSPNPQSLGSVLNIPFCTFENISSYVCHTFLQIPPILGRVLNISSRVLRSAPEPVDLNCCALVKKFLQETVYLAYKNLVY